MIDASSGKKSLRDLGSLPPAPGDVIADKYSVESVVGAGGMGLVVSARHVQLGHRVAIKLLRLNDLAPERQSEAVARFLREGRAAAGLTSDHVVRIHDVGTLDSGEPFMVMELLRGDDLAKLVDRQGPAPVPVAVDYILQACHAVAEAHQHGIVHRDLKPSNLFVSIRSDGRATVKVLDFGISKGRTGDDRFDGDLTDTRSVVGSPYYMSPEQVRNAKTVDARSDIWSLGMILYELLIGEPAFAGDTLPAICAAIAADEPRPPSERRADVPPELDAIVSKCLSKDPAARYASVVELVLALTPLGPGSDATTSAEYASRRDVTALSEPFGAVPKLPDFGSLLTIQTPPPSGGAPAGSDKASANTAVSAVPLADSGARPRRALVSTSTLVSPSSEAEPVAEVVGPAPAKARGRNGRWVLAAVIALIVFFVVAKALRSPSVATKPVPKAVNLFPTEVVTATPPLSPTSAETPPAPPASESPTESPSNKDVARSKKPVRLPSTPSAAKPTPPSDIRLER